MSEFYGHATLFKSAKALHDRGYDDAAIHRSLDLALRDIKAESAAVPARVYYLNVNEEGEVYLVWDTIELALQARLPNDIVVATTTLYRVGDTFWY